MIQTQFNIPIKAIRTDHGDEYTSNNFQSYLLHHGIHHQFSYPYTPEQNGIAKRKNRHILETACTLLHHASLPSIFWLEATVTAAYLINRLPTKTLNMVSPYQKLYHQPPSYLHLKTFGCLCYPWTAYSRAHKLDPKSSPCIFIGYSSNYKGFRCFDPATSKLIISCHVRFHEHEFPMANPTQPTPPPQISTIHTPLSPLFTSTFYPPPTTTNPIPDRPPTPTNPPPPLPPRKTDTHLQYHRRRPPTTTLPTPLLPPPLPLLEISTNHTPPLPFTINPSPPSISQLEPSPPPSPPDRPLPSHPMITRSKTNTPSTSINLSLTTSDPTTYQQASPYPHWQQAMSSEIQALHNQQTWVLVSKPPNHPILGSK